VSHSIDQVTPFYFGPPDKQLFGLYHAPDVDLEREYGVIICNPWGQEFVRAHRFLSQLALRLARMGFPVLRFDYFSTGDSTGADSEGTLSQWQADLRLAIQELKRRSRVEGVFLTSMRLGASISALVASGRDDVEGLVLWEPAVGGLEYEQDLISWNQEKQFYFLSRSASAENRLEMLGFELNETLVGELRDLNLLNIKRKPAGRILLLESAPSNDEKRPSIELFCQHLRALGSQVEYHQIETFKMWAEDPDKGLVPQPILQAGVDWLDRVGA
jgi:uncharacterized protein